MKKNASPLLQLSNVSKQYKLGDTLIHALSKVTVSVREGEFVAVMGASGSGKSTFLQVASMLAEPTSGKILLDGADVSGLKEPERAVLRNKTIGFVFQQFNLLARTSAVDNIALPLIYAGVNAKERSARAMAMLERVGLSDRLSNTPSQLSGGQQQRVAIARALINNPRIIFADEPTGNLDSVSTREILHILSQLHQDGATIIMVTHEAEVAAITSRVLTFQDGAITSDTPQKPRVL